MRLRKQIISAIMATCMTVTMIPVNMSLTTVEVKAEETSAVKNDDTQISEYSQYIPTGETYYNFSFNSSKLSNNKFTAVYLFDKDNKIVASTEKNGYINSYGERTSCGLYRTRELISGEELYLGYEVDSTVYVLSNTKITVTNRPYISSIRTDGSSNTGWKFNTDTDDTCIVEVRAYNTDFAKLSFTLTKNGQTVASSVSSTVVNKYNNEAYYCIKWNDGKTPDSATNYKVEYKYSDGGNVQNSIGADSFYYGASNGNPSYYENPNIRWNYKTSSVEYYNKNMPSGSEISYAIYDNSYIAGNSGSSTASGGAVSKAFVTSGGAIKVNDSHLATINLKEVFDKDKKNYYNKDRYYLYVYDTKGEIGHTDFRLGKATYYSVSMSLKETFYLSNDKEFEFSAGIVSSDESKLPKTCTADIIAYNYNNTTSGGTKNGQVTLTLENKNNSLSYNGIFKGSLPAGMYNLSFNTDMKHNSYSFYVVDSDKISLLYQSNNINYGTVNIGFPSNRIADWYCGEANAEIKDKLKIEISDIQGNKIGTYTSANNDFTVTGNSNATYRNISFSNKMKKDLNNLYFCYVLES